MRRCAAILVLLGIAACTGARITPPEADMPRLRPLRYRAEGERLPAFSGEDPAARGWVKVDDLIWVEARHAQRLEAGFVFDGARYVPVSEGLPAGVPATAGYRMRTDHVAVLTNLPWEDALQVAREAEAHVLRFFGAYGARLDIRFPDGPLPVVVTASRAELVAALRERMHGHVSWAAFYDALEGAVYVSTEPPPAGALPWVADLRHEMTHQMLDLARPPLRRTRPFGEGWFWLWEGIAVHSESLGAPGEPDPSAMRLDRFRARRRRSGVTPLDTLFSLDVTRFEGRHYDQTASVMRFLLAPGGAYRSRTLDLLRDLLDAPVPAASLSERMGATPAVLQTAWLNSLDHS